MYFAKKLISNILLLLIYCRNTMVGFQGLKLTIHCSLMFMLLIILDPKEFHQQMIYLNIITLVMNLEIIVRYMYMYIVIVHIHVQVKGASSGYMYMYIYLKRGIRLFRLGCICLHVNVYNAFILLKYMY